MKKKIKKIIATIISPFLRKKSTLSQEEARKILEDFSPKPSGDCYGENKLDIQYDLQIILPCYNVEKYLEECLASILNQETKYSYIVTAINDGSTDSTGEILSRYEKQYSNLEVITQKNKGLSGARNIALNKIKGKYLTFIDSDDLLYPDAIEIFMNKTKNNDIVQISWNLIDDQGKFIKQEIADKSTGFPWGKIFKADLFKNFQFPEGYLFEDTPLTFILYGMKDLKIKVLEDVLYGYRINFNSISRTANFSKRSIESFYITERCLQDFIYFGVEYNQRAYEYFLNQCIQNYGRTKNMPYEIREAIFVREHALRKQYFNNFNCQNKELKKIEKSLEKKQFLNFEINCWKL